MTTDTDLIRRMNAPRSPYSKSTWYKAFRFDAKRENLFSETNEEKHNEMRKRVGIGYSGKDNPNLESDMDQVIFKLINLITSHSSSQYNETKTFDFGSTIHYFTLDAITALALGKSFGWLEDGGRDKFAYCATIEATMPAMNFVSAVPFLLDLLAIPSVLNLALPSVKDRIGLGAIKGEAHKIIAQRFQSESKTQRRNDMLQSFIEHGLTEGEIADESLLQILAGSDTTALILRVIFTSVSSNSHIHRTLLEEIDAVGMSMDKVIPYFRATQLPYLNACIAEALRWYPVATGLTPRTVGPGGDRYNGLYLPPGTEIGMAAWSVFRHNPVYGKDAAIFRPDRWIEADSESLAKMQKEHELCFMYGTYKCMGERIARIELSKVVFELMRRFEFSVANPMQPFSREDCYGLMIQRGLNMTVRERKVIRTEP